MLSDRDMKPQNVLLNKSKDALVADLGTVRLAATKDRVNVIGEEQRQFLLNEKLKLFERCSDPETGGANVNQTHKSINATGVTAALGTPAYMAPEQTWSEEYSFPVDVWSYGCTLVRLFTLRDIYASGYGIRELMYAVAHNELRPIEVQIEDVPHSDVLDVINDCLQFQGNKRPSFKDIEQRLKNALDKCVMDSSDSGVKTEREKERRKIMDIKKARRIKRREERERKEERKEEASKEEASKEEKGGEKKKKKKKKKKK